MQQGALHVLWARLVEVILPLLQQNHLPQRGSSSAGCSIIRVKSLRQRQSYSTEDRQIAALTCLVYSLKYILLEQNKLLCLCSQYF